SGSRSAASRPRPPRRRRSLNRRSLNRRSLNRRSLRRGRLRRRSRSHLFRRLHNRCSKRQLLRRFLSLCRLRSRLLLHLRQRLLHLLRHLLSPCRLRRCSSLHPLVPRAPPLLSVLLLRLPPLLPGRATPSFRSRLRDARSRSTWCAAVTPLRMHTSWSRSICPPSRDSAIANADNSNSVTASSSRTYPLLRVLCARRCTASPRSTRHGAKRGSFSSATSTSGSPLRWRTTWSSLSCGTPTV